MRLLKSHTLTVKRKGESYFSEGKAHYDLTELSVVCSCQPVTGNDLQFFAEFAQELSKMKVYAKTELLLNDLIEYNGKTFRVFKTQDYTGFPTTINHYEVLTIEAPNVE